MSFWAFAQPKTATTCAVPALAEPTVTSATPPLVVFEIVWRPFSAKKDPPRSVVNCTEPPSGTGTPAFVTVARTMEPKPTNGLSAVADIDTRVVHEPLPPGPGEGAGAVGVSPEQPLKRTARPATNAAFGSWKRRMDVTSSLGTLRLDASQGSAVLEDHVECGDVGRDRLARKRVAVPRHASGLANLLTARLLVDPAVERKELVEWRPEEAVRRHERVVGERRRSVRRHEDIAAKVLRRRGYRPAVDAPPDDRVLVELHVEKLERGHVRVLESTLEGRRLECDRGRRVHANTERQQREVCREKHRRGAVALRVRRAAWERGHGEGGQNCGEGEGEFSHRSLLSE